jgi:hypothetical protein
LWTVAPGTILRTNSVADGGTTRSSIPCYKKIMNGVQCCFRNNRTNGDAGYRIDQAVYRLDSSKDDMLC